MGLSGWILLIIVIVIVISSKSNSKRGCNNLNCNNEDSNENIDRS